MRLRLPAVALLLLLCLAGGARADEKRQGYCQTQTTGARVTSCVIHVYLNGTTTHAQIYSDNLRTPKANPFTADATTGLWFFYADTGRYDLNESGGSPTISPAYTLSDFLFQDILALNAGLTLQYVASQTVGAAQTGFARLAPLDCISWRNNANSADNCLTENTANLLTYGGNTLALLGSPQTFTQLQTFSAGLTSTTATFSGAITASSDINIAGTLAENGNALFTGLTTVCRLGSVRYVDAPNSCNWVPGSDIGAWINDAIADLPTVTTANGTYRQGKIVLAPGGNLAVTQSTTAVVGAFVAVEGPGPQQLILSCTMNDDCWRVRDTPWGNNRGSTVSGFTLLGQGAANANAVGMHVGDLNSGRFDRINIDNFLGANSACFWVDNQNGWFERNDIKLELGAHTQASGETENGCTKAVRLTTSVNASSVSFNSNRWDVRMSLKASGQIGWSLEPTNPFNFYNCTILGNANMVAGAILFQISPATNGAGGGCYIDFKAESSGAATGWNTAANPPTPFTYLGPGIGRNGGSTAITDSIGANSLVNLSGITQTASIAGCTTGPVQFNFCDSALTWPLPFADTNYQVTCSGDGFTGTVGVLQGADMNGLKTTTAINVRTVTLAASQFTYTKITCTATRQGL